MVKKRLEITTKSPVSITAHKPYGQFYETLDYIPARTLRGAFAQSLFCDLKANNLQQQVKCSDCPTETQNDCDFYNLMAKEEMVKFGDCYAVNPMYVGDIHIAIPRILPATAVSCKYYPGFITGYDYYHELGMVKIKDEEYHGVFDLLVNQIVYDELASPNHVFNPKCPKCDGIIESFSGHYQVFPGANSNTYFNWNSKMRRFGRSALNRKTWNAQENMLYSVKSIAEENVFLGEVEINDKLDNDAMDELVNNLESLSNIGGQSSRGLGNVWIRVDDYQPNTFPLWCRIQKLNHTINMIRKRDTGRVYFTVDLQSDAILRGKLDEPTIQLSEEMLRNYLKDVDNQFDDGNFKEYDIKLERSYSSASYVGGWSTAWNLPKYVQLATAKGSVFLFSASKVDDLLCQSFDLLEQKGIGENREEGFGKVSICEQFHLEVEPK
jgi:CRISPR-associated protein Csx10